MDVDMFTQKLKDINIKTIDEVSTSNFTTPVKNKLYLEGACFEAVYLYDHMLYMLLNNYDGLITVDDILNIFISNSSKKNIKDFELEDQPLASLKFFDYFIKEYIKRRLEISNVNYTRVSVVVLKNKIESALKLYISIKYNDDYSYLNYLKYCVSDNFKNLKVEIINKTRDMFY